MASEEIERMKSEAELEQQYQMMRQQCQQLTYKINELKLDADEHDLVIEALKPLDKDRKCFRMVDAIVVERTVSDVLPAVQKNKDQVREPRTPLASDPPQPEPNTAQAPPRGQRRATRRGLYRRLPRLRHKSPPLLVRRLSAVCPPASRTPGKGARGAGCVGARDPPLTSPTAADRPSRACR